MIRPTTIICSLLCLAVAIARAEDVTITLQPGSVSVKQDGRQLRFALPAISCGVLRIGCD